MTRPQRIGFFVVTFGVILWWLSEAGGNLPIWSLGGPIFGTILWLGLLVKFRRERRRSRGGGRP